MTTAATTPSATAKTAWRGDDFPAWLSPMVVKELRQGVQAGSFAWTFIGLQAVMFFALSWAVANFGPDSGRTVVNALFWPPVAVGILLLVPLRGLGAISSERIGNNLDLVRLTRLSATKIVLGKWLAIMAQVGLITAAILPYLVLRYFFGGVNVIQDLEIMGWLLAGSMAVTAASLALSTQPLWVRIAMAVLTVPNTIAFGELFGSRGSPIGFTGGVERLGVLAVLVLYTVVLLEYTASRIAPVAENHALRKRSLALAIGVVWLVVGAWAPQPVALATMAATVPLLLTYAIEALLEQPPHLKSQAAAFARFGPPGRLAARLLTPGWASGLVFVLVLAAICMPAWWMVFWQSTSSSRDRLTATAFPLLLFAAVLFPLPAVVYFRRVKYRLLLYALVHLLSFMAFAYTNAMKPFSMLWANWEQGWMPLLPLPIASLASLLASDGSEAVARACIVAAPIVSAIVCLAMLPPWLEEMRKAGGVMAAVLPGRDVAARPDRGDAADAGASA